MYSSPAVSLLIICACVSRTRPCVQQPLFSFGTRVSSSFVFVRTLSFMLLPVDNHTDGARRVRYVGKGPRASWASRALRRARDTVGLKRSLHRLAESVVSRRTSLETQLSRQSVTEGRGGGTEERGASRRSERRRRRRGGRRSRWWSRRGDGRRRRRRRLQASRGRWSRTERRVE